MTIKLKVKNNFYARVPYFSLNNFLNINNMNQTESIQYLTNNFPEGILIESESLYSNLNNRQESKKLLSESATKYLIRSSTRTTPHGICVRILQGEFSNKKRTFNKCNDYRTIEFDFEWCTKFLKKIEEINFESLNITLNNHIEINENFVYNDWLDCMYTKNDKINTILDKKKPLICIINSLKNKKAKISDLTNLLKKTYNQEKIQIETIHHYLKELLDNQIICSDLKINMDEIRNTEWLFNKIKNYNVPNDVKQKLNEISFYINEYQNLSINSNSDHTLYKIISIMKSIFQSENYLCIDLYNNDLISLNPTLKEDIENYVNILSVVASSNTKTTEYYNKFIEKFGYQAVKIKDVINPITGIGMPTQNKVCNNKYYNIIKKYIFENSNEQIDISKVLQINDESKLNELNELELCFKIFHKNNSYFYETTPIVGSNQMYKIMGRFKEIKQEKFIVKDCDKIEIIYYPKISKVGNVLSCKNTSDYILDYGNNQSTIKKKVELDDIYVMPEKDKLILINKKTKHRIKFTNTNMTSLSFMPNILKSLVDISNMYEPNPFTLYLIIQDILKNISINKTIVYKNIILRPKTLEISDQDMKKESLISYIENWFDSKILYFGIKDNLLLLHINNKQHQAIIYKMYKQYRKLLIQQSDSWKYAITNDNKGNPYLAEYIFEIYNENKKYKNIPKYHELPVLNNIDNLDNIWLSFKLYMPKAYMNKFLTEYVIKFINENQNLIKSFFFIRYYDQEYHLRIRFLTSKLEIGNLFKNCFIAFNQYKEKGFIKKIILDEYIPEINRYGGWKNINDIEKIFNSSSIYCIHELHNKPESKNLYVKYILQVFYIISNINYNFSDILYEFKKYFQYYKRNTLTIV